MQSELTLDAAPPRNPALKIFGRELLQTLLMMSLLFLCVRVALQNFRVWQGARTHYRYWIDDTKPPFKS